MARCRLALDPASGVISGTPTEAGAFHFALAVTDSIGAMDHADFGFDSPPGDGTAGDGYDGSVGWTPPDGNGGIATCTSYAVVDGTLPDGLSLNPTTGRLSGTPAMGGEYAFTIACTTSGGQTAIKAFTIIIENPMPVLTSLEPSTAEPGGADFVLTLHGSRFVRTSVVRWGGSDRSTTYLSTHTLTATISAADIATSGRAQITVHNPTPGGGTSNTLDFTILDSNQPPTGEADSYSTLEDHVLTVSAANGVLKNDSDSDSGETLTAVLVSGPTNAAAFALNADGSFSYTPDSNFNGTDTFTYKVRDSHGAASASVTATIGVTEVNDAPALNPIANPALLDEDAGPQTISLSGISAGPANESGQSLTVTVTSSNPLLIPNPVVTYTSPNATGSLSFTPLPNANGSAEITIVVKDNVGTANGGQNTSTSVTFTVTVTPINDPPTIVVGRGAQCASPNTPTGTITILVGDVESGASSLTLAGNSSNQALIPNGNMTFGGSGANRTATITALLNTGTAAITIIVMMVR